MNGHGLGLKVKPNITPMTDAALTLIVIFLITMPAMLWTGLKIDATEAVSGDNMEDVKAVHELITVNLTGDSIYVNGRKIPMEDLQKHIAGMIKCDADRPVIVLSDPDIKIDRVVEVFDKAKLSGAEKLALLKKKNFN